MSKTPEGTPTMSEANSSKSVEQLAEEYISALPEMPNYRYKEWAREGYKVGYAAGSAKWVSVKERLPEDYESYLVICMHGFKHKALFNGAFSNDITHWLDNVPPIPGEEK